MLTQTTARLVLEKALSTGGDFAEIFFEDKVAQTLLSRNDQIETVSIGRIHGAGIRIFDGLKCLYAYTNDTTEAGLLACAAGAAAAVKNDQRVDALPLTSLVYTAMHPVTMFPKSTPHDKRVALLREATHAAKDVSAEIAQVICQISDSDQHVTIANSEGVFAEDRRVRCRMGITAIATNGTENQTGFSGPGALMGLEFFQTVNPADAARIAAHQAVTALHAPYCKAGQMPIVMAGGFGGVIFHEACGHSLEATSVSRGDSEFCGKLGQRIAPDCVTAIDDGTIPNAWGSIHIDDEGMPTNRLVLIQNGILTNYMIDKMGGLRMGMAPTGSGRRESYQYAPTSRMRNTFIAEGTDDDDAILAATGEGLYAASMGGGSVNPVTGEFNFAVNEGYLIKNGKIDSPVRGASLIGRGSEVLRKIDRVGKVVTHGQGMCGSMSGSVPTNVGQPTIRIESLTVGGQEA